MVNSIVYTIGYILLTVFIYRLSLRLNRKLQSPFTTPVFFGTTTIIILMSVSHIEYRQYVPAKDIMTFLLGPATVALAIPLHKNIKSVIQFAFPAAMGLVFGTIVSTVISIFLSQILRLSSFIIPSMEVKTVTIPIAIEVSRILDGDPTISVAFVVMMGTLGAMIGSWLLNKTRVTHPMSRGLALGTMSHGQGTATAATEGEIQATFAGVAMGVSGILVPFVAPILHRLFVN